MRGAGKEGKRCNDLSQFFIRPPPPRPPRNRKKPQSVKIGTENKKCISRLSVARIGPTQTLQSR